MNANLKPYARQFSLYYFLGYLICLPLLLIINTTWHLHASDIIIIVSLSMALPMLTSDKFIKNEGRFFTQEEQTQFVKKSALNAMLISLLPAVFYSATLIFIKLFAPAEAINYIKLQHAIDSIQSDMTSLNSLTIIAMTLFSALFYYVAIRLSMNSAIKSLRKRYEKIQKVEN